MSDQFQQIDAAWTTIQNAYPDAFKACTTPDEQTSVTGTRDIARDAWYAALNKTFHDSDASVQLLTQDLTNENAAMNADLDGLKQVGEYLTVAKAAAKTAAALAALAV